VRGGRARVDLASALLLAALLVSCGGEVTAPAPSPSAPAASTDEQAPTAAGGALGSGATQKTDAIVVPALDPDVWTAERIGALTPTLPLRSAKTPAPLPATEGRYPKTARKLEEHVRNWGRTPGDAWAIGHALLALGPDMMLSNGEAAVPWLFRTFAVEYRAGGRSLIRFPRSAGKVRVEPHAALMLKIFAEIGVSPDLPVVVGGNAYTVADLYRGVLIHSALEPRTNHSTFESPNDMPWALQALATWAPLQPTPAAGGAAAGPPDLRWVAADGTRMSLRDFSVFNAGVLVAESQPLFVAMESGAAFEKKGQGIVKYTCGGAHLLQGVAFATARGLNTELGAKAVAGQVRLAFWRLPQELALYDALTKQHPEHTDLLLVQRLKYTGHFLESMHKMAAMGIFSPDPTQQKLLVGAADQVVLTVEALQQRGVLAKMDALRTSNEQMYLDLIGDAAHAARGLRLALGEDSVAY
jgi:hypothetical protein